MKKSFIAICLAIVFVFLFSSCVESYFGNYGVVESVELINYRNSKDIEYKYIVTVYHDGNECCHYKIYTNENYCPGDSIKIGLNRK